MFSNDEYNPQEEILGDKFTVEGYALTNWQPPWIDNGAALIAKLQQMADQPEEDYTSWGGDKAIAWQVASYWIYKQLALDLSIVAEVNRDLRK